MIPLSGNQDLTYPDATGHFWITSGPTKATVHPVKRSWALQQLTCALVANAKCHIVSAAAYSPSWRGLQQLHSFDDVPAKWQKTYNSLMQQQHCGRSRKGDASGYFLWLKSVLWVPVGLWHCFLSDGKGIWPVWGKERDVKYSRTICALLYLCCSMFNLCTPYFKVLLLNADASFLYIA